MQDLYLSLLINYTFNIPDRNFHFYFKFIFPVKFRVNWIQFWKTFKTAFFLVIKDSYSLSHREKSNAKCQVLGTKFFSIVLELNH